MKFFGRKYSLTLSDPSGGSPITFEGGPDKENCLDIEFDIEWTGSSPRAGTVSIYGLSMEKISKYVGLSCLADTVARSKKIKLTLKAGYEDPGMVDIIDGLIVSGEQSKPPEIKLTLKVDEIFKHYAGVSSIGFKEPTKLSDLIKGLVEPFGISFDPGANASKATIDFNEKFTIPSKERDLVSVLDWIERLVGKTNTVRIDGGALWIYGEESSNKSVTINSESGIQMVDGISFTGMNVTMNLQDHDGPLFPKVNLESDFFKHANGEYRVKTKCFRGHYRGDNWSTTYKCYKTKYS